MIQTVKKRDGRIVGYNEEKIKAALQGGNIDALGEENTDEDGLVITEEFE